jgi:hypothetical protein
LNRELASLVDWQTAIDMAKRYIELRSGPETGADDRVKQAYQLWLVFYAQHCAADDRFTQKDRDKLRDIMAQQDGYIARVTPGEYEVSDSRRQFRQDLIAAVEEQAGGPGR